MMQKQIFRTHIVLRIGGRLFTLIMALFPFFLTGMSLYWIAKAGLGLLWMLLPTAVMWAICIFLVRYFWQLCWGKLAVEEDKVIWKCLFHKPVKIFYSEIKEFSVQEFKEGNVAYYKNAGDSFRYVLISNKNLPEKRIDKIKSGKGLIKFQYTKALMQALRVRMVRPQ